MSRHTRATTVVSQPPRFSTSLAVGAAEAQPGFLDGVVGLAQRAEHPVGHRSQVGPLLLEPLRQPVALVHPCRFSFPGFAAGSVRRGGLGDLARPDDDEALTLSFSCTASPEPPRIIEPTDWERCRPVSSWALQPTTASVST